MKKLTRKVLGVVLCLSLLLGFSVSIDLFARASESRDIFIKNFGEYIIPPQRESYIVKVDRCEDDTFDVYVSDTDLAELEGIKYPQKIKEPYDNSYFNVIYTGTGFQVRWMSHYKTSIWIIPDTFYGKPLYFTQDTKVCWVGPSENKQFIVPSRMKPQFERNYLKAVSYEEYRANEEEGSFYSELIGLFQIPG